MKEVNAYIKKHKLDDVVYALHRIGGLTGLSIIERKGYGINWALAETPSDDDFRSGVKVEFICDDELVDEVVNVIKSIAHTGLKGDGVIYISDVDSFIKI